VLPVAARSAKTFWIGCAASHTLSFPTSNGVLAGPARWELGKSWPRRYDRTLIIAQHGSADRSSKVGYRLVAVDLSPPSPGAPPRVVAHRELVTGWLGGRRGAPRGSQPSWGRPADVLQLPDGSLLISDDAGHTIYRLRYVKS
jgi:glucose/arabinose dehydrogenase